jgi:hypothetical protein
VSRVQCKHPRSQLPTRRNTGCHSRLELVPTTSHNRRARGFPLTSSSRFRVISLAAYATKTKKDLTSIHYSPILLPPMLFLHSRIRSTWYQQSLIDKVARSYRSCALHVIPTSCRPKVMAILAITTTSCWEELILRMRWVGWTS